MRDAIVASDALGRVLDVGRGGSYSPPSVRGAVRVAFAVKWASGEAMDLPRCSGQSEAGAE